MKLHVEVKVAPAVRGLRGLAAAQLPFAMALALTRTALDAQAAVRRDLPSRFTLRNRWVQRGIGIVPATKANQQAVVGSRDAFMALQETGGTKTAQKSRHVAIPQPAVRRSKRGLITKANRPRQVLDKPRAFVARLRGGTLAIVRRVGKKRLPLQVLYVLSRRARISPRFGFRATVERIVAQRFDANFIAALLRALGTRK